MKKFAIHIEIDRARVEERIAEEENIDGIIYILVEKSPFPADRWFDYPVTILGWWLEGYLKLSKDEVAVDNDFMDGPFKFISTKDQDKVRLTFRQRTHQGEVEVRPAIVTAMTEYQDELIQTAKSLLDILNGYSASGADIDSLRNVLNKVQAVDQLG